MRTATPGDLVILRATEDGREAGREHGPKVGDCESLL